MRKNIRAYYKSISNTQNIIKGISKIVALAHKNKFKSLFDKKQSANFVLMKIRYIDNKELDSFITENSNSSLIMLLFTSSYSHLLKSLSLLQKIVSINAIGL